MIALVIIRSFFPVVKVAGNSGYQSGAGTDYILSMPFAFIMIMVNRD